MFFSLLLVQGRMAEWSKALVLGTSHYGGAGSNPAPVRCFFRSTIVVYKSSHLSNSSWTSQTNDCVDWIRHLLISQFCQVPNNNKCYNWFLSTHGRMAEWSKALVEGTSHFGGAGSNPAPVKFISLLLANATSALSSLQNSICLWCFQPCLILNQTNQISWATLIKQVAIKQIAQSHQYKEFKKHSISRVKGMNQKP